MDGTSWKSFIVVCRWCLPKCCLNALDYSCTKLVVYPESSVCPLCFAFPNHAYYSRGSSASTITSSKITKVWELQVFRTSQDTNTFHLQQGSLYRCLRVVLLVIGILADRSEEAVVKWCHLLSHSFRYFKSGRSVLKRVIIPQQQRSTWGGTGRSDESKDATHGWGTPRASTKALRCTEGDPTFAFRSATPLWSSIGQLQQNEGWISFCRDSRDGQNFVHKLVLKQHNLQLMLVRMTNESKPGRNFVNSPFWSNTTYNLHLG